MKTFRMVAAALAVMAWASIAAAEWVDGVMVERVRAYTRQNPYALEVWFDKPVAANCHFTQRAAVRTTDPVVLENLRDIALSAFLARQQVEVQTTGECFDSTTHGGVGVLEYISIRTR